ncbi:MAG: HDOD domain-containing protein [Curvibacter sp.]|nr:MAG: HDOD domain-containing protein [Curvibacter sp.]
MKLPNVLPLDRAHCIDQVRALPSLPAVVVQLMALLQQQDVNLDPIVETLSLDQALVAKVLQLANSPFYGMSGRITSIRDGINILGLRPLGTLVLAAVLTVQFERMHGKALHLDEFWNHSIACGVAARALAEDKGLDEASAFTAGLLHDVGLLVLDSLYPIEMAQAMQWAAEHDAPHLQAERALLGVSHAEVGAWLAAHWHFPPEVVEAIARHHNPPDSAQLSLTDLVHGANALVHALDLAGVAHEAVPPLQPGVWDRMAPSRQNMPRLLARVEQEFEQLRAILRPPQETSA